MSRFNIPGIYVITDLTNGKFYIGSSVNIRNRFAMHFHNSRGHKILSKLPKSKIRKQLLEKVDLTLIDNKTNFRKYLIDREQFWLDTLKPFGEVGYNKARKAINTDKVSRHGKRTVVLTSPDGKNFLVTNISKFCKDNNLSKAGMHNIIKGLSLTCKGWTCKEATLSKCSDCGKATIKTKVKCNGCQHKKDYVLVSPNGEKTYIHGLRNFCADNNLSFYCVHDLVRRRIKNYKGWRLP